MRKRGLPETIVKAVMSWYDGATTKVAMGLRMPEELRVEVGVHQGWSFSPLIFAIVVGCGDRERKRRSDG